MTYVEDENGKKELEIDTSTLKLEFEPELINFKPVYDIQLEIKPLEIKPLEIKLSKYKLEQENSQLELVEKYLQGYKETVENQVILEEFLKKFPPDGGGFLLTPPEVNYDELNRLMDAKFNKNGIMEEVVVRCSLKEQMILTSTDDNTPLLAEITKVKPDGESDI